MSVSTPGFAQLPPEVWLHIFRLLPLDVRLGTLFNLALVSRAVHGLANVALYDAVVLRTDVRMGLFAEAACAEPARAAPGLVRGLSPWYDNIAATRAILARCPSLLNIQATSDALQAPYAYAWERGLETLFVWLKRDTTLSLARYAGLKRLHIADLQSLASLATPRDIASLFSPRNLPRLEVLSSTWAPYQMFDDDHEALCVVALAALKLPTLRRFVVRHVGLRVELPSLEALSDPRIVVRPFEPRDPVLADNLAVWTLDALGVLDMWSGQPLEPSNASDDVQMDVERTQMDVERTGLDVVMEEESVGGRGTAASQDHLHAWLRRDSLSSRSESEPEFYH